MYSNIDGSLWQQVTVKVGCIILPNMFFGHTCLSRQCYLGIYISRLASLRHSLSHTVHFHISYLLSRFLAFKNVECPLIMWGTERGPLSCVLKLVNVAQTNLLANWTYTIFLGIQIDSKLNFSKHSEIIAKKLNHILLHIIKDQSSLRFWKKVYFATFQDVIF